MPTLGNETCAAVLVSLTAAQRGTQLACSQRGVAAPHEVRHEPQNCELLVVSTSQPSSARSLQFAQPFSHGPRAHAPATQSAAPCGALHGAHEAAAQPVAGAEVETQALPHAFVPSGQAAGGASAGAAPSSSGRA
jgi:hypothetical protein